MVIFRPRDSSRRPMEAEATPFPKLDTTPPVMKMYLELISQPLGERPPTDHGATQIKERQMHFSKPFITNPEAPELVDPTESAFNHPAVLPQAVFGAPPGDLGSNPHLPQRPP